MLTPQEQQIETAWTKLSNHQREHLARSVNLLAAVHNRRMSEDAVMMYCKRLSPYALTAGLYSALASLADAERMPSIGAIKSAMRGRTDLEPFKPIPQLTPEQEAASDKSAIMSMLWLHYAKGWGPSEFRGSVFERRFGVDTARALAAAKELYAKETILAWMQAQETKAKREDEQYSRSQGG